MKRLVIGIGEALWDVFPTNELLGGAPANFAYHVSQLGFDGIIVSAVGDDERGRKLIEELDARGIRHKLSLTDYDTGTVNAFPQPDGDVKYVITHDVAYDHIPFTEDLASLVPDVAAVCFGTLAQRQKGESAETIRKLLRSIPDDALKVYDINIRPTCDGEDAVDIYRESLKLSNILKINQAELKVMAAIFGLEPMTERQQCEYFIKEYSLSAVICTLAEKGSRIYYIDAPDADIKVSECCVNLYELAAELNLDVEENADAVGAGDSFTASFIAGILNGETVERSHLRASRIAAYVCTRQGAMPKLDSRL